MNRIKELWEQTNTVNETAPRIVVTTEGTLEKFAELIIQECAKCIITGTYDAEPPYDKIIPLLLNELADGMKKHFGIDQ